MLYLLVDLAGQTVGSLLDPIMWAVMALAAFKVRMRYIVAVALAYAFVSEAALWALEPPELRVYRFAAYTLIGRTLAAWAFGSVTRAVVVRQRRRVPATA